MNVFILAAGFGKRMRDLTASVPKPMLAINGIRLIDYSLYLCHLWGVDKIWVNTFYLSEIIRDHLKNFKGKAIFVSEEKDKILGTAGGIRTAYPMDSESENLILINPDTIILPNKNFKIKNKLPANSKIHLYLKPIPANQSYTKISLSSSGKVSFGSGDLYYIGLAIIDVRCLKKIPQNEYADLSDTFKELEISGKITGEVFLGEVLDLGTKELWESYSTKDIFGAEKTKIQNFIHSNF
ncbi:sugar phosphate nucleotidyltransferase [Leptospira sp. 96542]|nr:sugar phosphate nucleotidyltransferase [Leptospira sp. 96542]